MLHKKIHPRASTAAMAAPSVDMPSLRPPCTTGPVSSALRLEWTGAPGAQTPELGPALPAEGTALGSPAGPGLLVWAGVLAHSHAPGYGQGGPGSGEGRIQDQNPGLQCRRPQPLKPSRAGVGLLLLGAPVQAKPPPAPAYPVPAPSPRGARMKRWEGRGCRILHRLPALPAAVGTGVLEQ